MRLSWRDATQDLNHPADAIAMALRAAGVVGDAVTLQTWPLRQSPALDLCVWSADRQQAREAISKSYESLLEGTGPAIPLASQAIYSDGEWAVVITRPLVLPGLDRGAQLAPRRFVPVAFTVWDGGNGGQRAVSSFVDLALQEPSVAPKKPETNLVVVWVVSGVVLVIALALVFKKP